MKIDPMETVEVTQGERMPRASGQGSGKAAWMSYGVRQAENVSNLWDMIHRQSDTIKELQAEIELLRTQIETRKPKGGRPRTPDSKAQRIEAELEAGYSKRSIAARHRVSAMTVVRIAKRVAARATSKN